MEMRYLDGIGVRASNDVSILTPTLVGIRFGHLLPKEQCTRIRKLHSGPSHIAVQENKSGGTSILCTIRVASEEEARDTLAILAMLVTSITGAESIICELPDYLSVSRALAA